MSQTGCCLSELIPCIAIFSTLLFCLLEQDLTEDLLPLVLDPIVTALKDDDDDVRAVAASALLPVAESLVTFAPNRVSTASFTCSTQCFRNFVETFVLFPVRSAYWYIHSIQLQVLDVCVANIELYLS